MEQQRQSAAHSALTSEHQSLQQQQAEMAVRLTQLQEQLEAEQTKASEVTAESAQWKRQYEESATEEKRLRDENTEYSKRLLDVVRPAGVITLPAPAARIANGRDVSSMDQLLPSALSYSAIASAPSSPVVAAVSPIPAMATPHFAPPHSYSQLSSSLYSTASSSSSLSFQPANLSSALAAAASSPVPSAVMSAHKPHTTSSAPLPPPLSLDALMSSAAPPSLPHHPRPHLPLLTRRHCHLSTSLPIHSMPPHLLTRSLPHCPVHHRRLQARRVKRYLSPWHSQQQATGRSC